MGLLGTLITIFWGFIPHSVPLTIELEVFYRVGCHALHGDMLVMNLALRSIHIASRHALRGYYRYNKQLHFSIARILLEHVDHRAKRLIRT